jgi:hypothetical protein
VNWRGVEPEAGGTHSCPPRRYCGPGSSSISTVISDLIGRPFWRAG